MHRIKKNALFLIDSSYLLYRSYYAMRPLKTSKGESTQAVYGFCRTIKKVIDQFDPKNIVLAWDSKGKTFRQEMYESYKATRQAPPSDLFIQKERILEFADLIKLKQIAKAGYEADDIIGSISKDYRGEQVVIVTADKDLYQLLSDKILIFDPFKDKVVDDQTFTKEKGFPPTKVQFFYSLLGDTSDNIPGVFGVGKKSAEELVKNFESLEDLYENLDKVRKDRIRNLLKENKNNAFLSEKLFSLRYYDFNFTKEDFIFDKKNLINATPLFEELEFNSLIKSLKDTFGKEIVEKKLVLPIKADHQLSIFGKDERETKKILECKIRKKWKCCTIIKMDELNKLVEKLSKAKEFAFDTETGGLKALQDGLVGISFAMDKKTAYYIPLGHDLKEDENQLDINAVLIKLKPIFENPKIKKVLQHAKFDCLALWPYFVNVNGVEFDTLIAASLLKKSDEEKINLKALSYRYLDEPMRTFKEVLDKQKDFSKVDLIRAAEYGAHDSLQTLKLKYILDKDLKKEDKLNKIFYKLEMPLSKVLFKMERKGIKLDIKKLEAVGLLIEKDLEIVEGKILGAIEHKHKKKWSNINLNSPQQVAEFLFDELKLPVVKRRGKSTRSTDQEVLFQLSKIHPIPGLILKYRELAKLRNTYIKPLIKQVNPKTERIHTTFSQTMVATGRLASSEPNLQNIPVSSEHGIKIRSAFIADKNKILLSADYSQMELRVLAHITKDKNLIDAFMHNIDIHTQTASQIFDVPIEKVTKEQRQLGKRINFGIAYGQTPYGLAKDLDIKLSKAKEYIDIYFEKYKNVAKWIEKTVERAKEVGYVETFMGRRRYLPRLKEENRHLFEAARRMAINTPIQGTAAEIMKKAMINIDKVIEEKKLKANVLLQVHDELIVELVKEDTNIIEKMIKKEMENVVNWSVPFKISIKIGKNWEEITK